MGTVFSSIDLTIYAMDVWNLTSMQHRLRQCFGPIAASILQCFRNDLTICHACSHRIGHRLEGRSCKRLRICIAHRIGHRAGRRPCIRRRTGVVPRVISAKIALLLGYEFRS